MVQTVSFNREISLETENNSGYIFDLTLTSLILFLQELRKMMAEEKVKGFINVLVAKNVTDGLASW